MLTVLAEPSGPVLQTGDRVVVRRRARQEVSGFLS
jgi:hypothetical protein